MPFFKKTAHNRCSVALCAVLVPILTFSLGANLVTLGVQTDCKVYVNVRAVFLPDGKMLPEELTWEDGTPYTIDRILNMKPSVARKAGGQGDCYTILVNGKQSHLFFERSTNLTGAYIGRWFVERKP